MIFFILGSHPDIARAEISSVLNLAPDDLSGSDTAALLEHPHKNLGDLQDRIASVIKIGHIIGELPKWNVDDAQALMSAYAANASGKEKIRFGISVYSLENDALRKQMRKDQERLGLEIKKQLKEQTGRPVRYVSSKETTLSSVTVDQQELLASGGEFVLFAQKDRILVGQTESVQDYQAWSQRDYGRPAADAKSGMLPPKLARSMINLSGIDPVGSTLLDPFCGSGTVLMEASLLGCKTIVGSDISEKAIQDTSRNMTWLVDQGIIEQPKLSLFESPAQNLSEQFQGPVDMIITETFLGKPRFGRESKDALYEHLHELADLNKNAWQTLIHLLKPGGKAVVAFPIFLMRNNKHLYLPVKDALKEMGWEIEQSLEYKREGQLVGREIVVMKKS